MTMTDKVFLKGVRLKARLGIYAWEQAIEQTVLMDLEMQTEAASAAQHDQIDHTLNYQKVVERVRSWLPEQRFQLVETLAEQIAQLIKQEFAVSWLRLTLHKPYVFSDIESVGVVIER